MQLCLLLLVLYVTIWDLKILTHSWAESRNFPVTIWPCPVSESPEQQEDHSHGQRGGLFANIYVILIKKASVVSESQYKKLRLSTISLLNTLTGTLCTHPSFSAQIHTFLCGLVLLRKCKGSGTASSNNPDPGHCFWREKKRWISFL